MLLSWAVTAIKMSEIFRVRNSLTMWVWIPLRLRVKHYDKRFQREMRREFSSVWSRRHLNRKRSVQSTTNTLIFSTTSFSSRHLSSSVWSYNNCQKWLTHLSRNERFYRQFQTIRLQSRISPTPGINVVCRCRQIGGFKTQQWFGRAVGVHKDRRKIRQLCKKGAI